LPIAGKHHRVTQTKAVSNATVARTTNFFVALVPKRRVFKELFLIWDIVFRLIPSRNETLPMRPDMPPRSLVNQASSWKRVLSALAEIYKENR
jgi:hypothetical protein